MSTPMVTCLLLCRQVWRWLLEARHGVHKDHRQQLMHVMKALVYADTEESFRTIWEIYLASPLAERYDTFTR